MAKRKHARAERNHDDDELEIGEYDEGGEMLAAPEVASELKCQGCTFFFVTAEDGHEGTCKRWPLEMIVFGNNAVAKQPTVQATDWCGEYQPAVPTE